MLIRIMRGGYGHKPAGKSYTTLVKAGDPPIDVPEAEARRLASMGVAEILNVEAVATAQEEKKAAEAEGSPIENAANAGPRPTEPAGVGTSSGDDGNAEGEPPWTKPAYSVTMKQPELKALMAQFGIAFRIGMSKAQMVEALDAEFDVLKKDTSSAAAAAPSPRGEGNGGGQVTLDAAAINSTLAKKIIDQVEARNTTSDNPGGSKDDEDGEEPGDGEGFPGLDAEGPVEPEGEVP